MTRRAKAAAKDARVSAVVADLLRVADELEVELVKLRTVLRGVDRHD